MKNHAISKLPIINWYTWNRARIFFHHSNWLIDSKQHIICAIWNFNELTFNVYCQLYLVYPIRLYIRIPIRKINCFTYCLGDIQQIRGQNFAIFFSYRRVPDRSYSGWQICIWNGNNSEEMTIFGRKTGMTLIIKEWQ